VELVEKFREIMRRKFNMEFDEESLKRIRESFVEKVLEKDTIVSLSCEVAGESEILAQHFDQLLTIGCALSLLVLFKDDDDDVFHELGRVWARICKECAKSIGKEPANMICDAIGTLFALHFPRLADIFGRRVVISAHLYVRKRDLKLHIEEGKKLKVVSRELDDEQRFEMKVVCEECGKTLVAIRFPKARNKRKGKRILANSIRLLCLILHISNGENVQVKPFWHLSDTSETITLRFFCEECGVFFFDLDIPIGKPKRLLNVAYGIAESLYMLLGSSIENVPPWLFNRIVDVSTLYVSSANVNTRRYLQEIEECISIAEEEGLPEHIKNIIKSFASRIIREKEGAEYII